MELFDQTTRVLRRHSAPSEDSLIPLTGPLSSWAKQVSRPLALSSETLRDRAGGALYPTNWRLLLVRGDETESILLADISGVEYSRDALACTLRRCQQRLVLALRETLQVGLRLARPIRSVSHWTR